TPTDYVGEMVGVLAQDFQVRWVWDAFDHLDVNRGPVLGEGAEGPERVVPRLPAVGWLHVNAVALSPTDGNLILSVRMQDWVIKIDYRNGTGDGHVVWRLGQGGDFVVNSADPNPWFSHQHNAHYIDDHTLILFDTGNTRRASDPNAHSRGQVWTLDETSLTRPRCSMSTWATTRSGSGVPSGSRTGTIRSRPGARACPPRSSLKRPRCSRTAPRPTSWRATALAGSCIAPTGRGPCTRAPTTRWREHPRRGRMSSSTTARRSALWSTASLSPSAAPPSSTPGPPSCAGRTAASWTPGSVSRSSAARPWPSSPSPGPSSS